MTYSPIIDTCYSKYLPVKINFKSLGNKARAYIESLQDGSNILNINDIFKVSITLKDFSCSVSDDNLKINHITLDNTDISKVPQDYIIPLITSPLGLLQIMINNLPIATFKKNYTHLAYFIEITKKGALNVYFVPVLNQINDNNRKIIIIERA